MAVDRLAYSVDEAAELLGIGRTLAYDLIRERQLPSIKLGNRRLVTKADLEGFVEELRNGLAA